MRKAHFVKVPEELEKLLPPVEDLVFAHGAFGEPRDTRPPPGAPRAVAQRTDQSIGGNTLVELILFGKIHYVTVKDYCDPNKPIASRFATSLLLERDLLLDQVRTIQRIEGEWRAGFVAWLFSSHGKPDEVLDALGKVLEKLPDLRSDPESEALREEGIVLHQVRTAIDRLNTDLGARREQAISNAETATQYTQLVEDTAFQALLQASTFVPALRTPLAELAYRISIVFIEAGARAGGAWIAGSPAWREVFAVAKSRLPQVLVDTFMTIVRTYLGPAAAERANAVGLVIVQQIVELAFDVAMLVIDGVPPGKKPDDVITDLVEKRVVSVFGVLLGGWMGYSPNDSRLKDLIRRIVESLVLVVAQEIRSLEKRAKEEKRERADIVLSEAPWLIARIFQNVLLGMLRGAKSDPSAFDHQRPASARDTIRLIRAQARQRRLLFAGSAPGPIQARTPGIPAAPRLGWREFLSDWQRLGLSRVVLHTMLRSVEDGGAIIEARATNRASAAHTTEPGVSMKPSWCKPKTANRGGPQLEGKVTRPSELTHDDVPRAMEAWRKGVSALKENGCLVRGGDGLVFHPDQLVEWSRAQPDKAFIRTVADTLRSAPPDVFELDSPQGTTWLRQKLANDDEHAAALAVLSRARVGFSGDTDLVQVIDAPTNKVVPVGDEVSMPGSPAYRQNKDRLRALNKIAGALQGAREDQETAIGRQGKEVFQHGGAAERLNENGTLEFSGLGTVYAVTRNEQGLVRWIVDVSAGEISIPREMAGRLPQGLRAERGEGRYTTVRMEPVDVVFSRLVAEMSRVPQDQPGAAFSVISKLGLTHLDAATQQRFARDMHGWITSNDPGHDAIAKTHLADALTLTRMKQLRDIHLEMNRELLSKHPRSPTFQGNPVAEDAERRRYQPKPGRLSKIRLKDRPRTPPAQVRATPPEQGSPIGLRSIEAGLLARGLTLLALENEDAFKGPLEGSAFALALSCAESARLTVGIDATGNHLVIAAFAEGPIGDAVERFGELIRMGLDGAKPKLWWELYRSVLPVSSSYVAGAIDDGGISARARAALADRWTAAETRPHMRLVAFRVRREIKAYPASDEALSFLGSELDEVWWDESRMSLQPRKVRLVDRPIAVFLGCPISVPEDSPRVTRPLEADRADLVSVRGIQRALHLLGYLEREPDGVLDGPTREAIGTFQADADAALVVDYVVGPKTRAALRDALRALELGE